MMTFPRSAVRSFRAVVRKGVPPRSREPAPPVVLLPDAKSVTFLTHLPAVVIAYHMPSEQSDTVPVVVPMAAFDTVAGPGNEPITLESKGMLRAELRWNDRGQARTQEVELERFGENHQRPAEPPVLAPMPRDFLDAWHEAGRTAGAAGTRYAFDRIQLKGRTGEVVASDGHTAFVQGGFDFPFQENLLLPALPVFGTPELGRDIVVGFGRTETHAVVKFGRWTFWWVLDAAGQYPDVTAVVPKPSASTVTLDVDDADAAALQAALPTLPGVKEPRRPVTLEMVAGKPPTVRAGSESEGTVEVRLERSTVAKGSVRVAVDRTFLARALRLGCRSFRAVDADRPVVGRKGSLTLLGGALDPSLIVESAGPDPRKPGKALAVLAPPTHGSELSLGPASVVHLPADSPATVDPLLEAEALGSILVEAGQRLGRLVGWFHAHRREPRTWLQSLSTRPRGGAP